MERRGEDSHGQGEERGEERRVMGHGEESIVVGRGEEMRIMVQGEEMIVMGRGESWGMERRG